jgi:hypothetical protein
MKPYRFQFSIVKDKNSLVIKKHITVIVERCLCLPLIINHSSGECYTVFRKELQDVVRKAEKEKQHNLRSQNSLSLFSKETCLSTGKNEGLMLSVLNN